MCSNEYLYHRPQFPMHLDGGIYDDLADLVLWNHIGFTFNAETPRRGDATSLRFNRQPFDFPDPPPPAPGSPAVVSLRPPAKARLCGFAPLR